MSEGTVVDTGTVGRVRLDWKQHLHPLSLKFTITDHFHLGVRLSSRTWTLRRFLNQGDTPGCTGWSAAHVMLSTPKVWPNLTDREAMAWYLENQRQDEWEGENYEGSSVTGACRAGKMLGYYTDYFWATTLDEIRHGVAQFGPMQIGSRWLAGMMNPDSDGYLNLEGPEVGGHAYTLGAYNQSGDFFWIYQTWGLMWGLGGKAKIRAVDLGELVLDGTGEAALPRKKVWVPV